MPYVSSPCRKEAVVPKTSRAALSALGLLLIGLCLGVRGAAADVQFARAGATGWLSTSGAYVLVSGPLRCTAGEAYTVVLSVAQEASAAQAAGRVNGVCVGDTQRWAVTADVLVSSPPLLQGPALLCWNIRTGADATATDLEQGCVPLTLETG
jgi:hypothetical protein